MGLFRGLSGRLLILTVLVVMVVEVAIFVPSVARYRLEYLNERLVRAQVAALTLLTSTGDALDDETREKLLAQTQVHSIVVKGSGVNIPVVQPENPAQVWRSFDLREGTALTEIRDALQCLTEYFCDGVLRIVGSPAPGEFDEVEITIDSAPLRAEMLDYGWRIFKLSLVISIITAVFVFILVRTFVVSPILGVIENVTAFRENPEDPERVMEPSSRLDEVADAERALADMQRVVMDALRERSRLASLGEALAKISHDLRNMLASGQLMVDRLEMSSDPLVARVLPKLVGSLDRAIRLCQSTLDFGKPQERPAELRQIRLAPMALEVLEGLGLDAPGGYVRAEVTVADGVEVSGDPEHLYRVLANLVRNAAEAIRASMKAGEITIEHARVDGTDRISVIDTGPGLPLAAQQHLFEPFRGGVRQGGSGLGLAIANELVRAQGGRLDLAKSSADGTVFHICLPIPNRKQI